MNWQDPAAVFELKQEGPSSGSLKPGAVMVGRVVVTDGGVVAANRQIKIIVQRVLQNHAFNIHAKHVVGSASPSIDVVRSSFEDDFSQKLEFVRNVRSNK